MHELIDSYIEVLRSRLHGRVDGSTLEELLLEVRSHYVAALELCESERDPSAAAIALLGPPEDLAIRYRRENHRTSGAAFLLALILATVFYIQPVIYVINDRMLYLFSQPLVWINAAVLFIVACAWVKRSLFLPLTALVLGVSAVTTVWLAPNYVYAPDPYGDKLRYSMIPSREAQRTDRAFLHTRTEVRKRVEGLLLDHIQAYSAARSPKELPETVRMEDRFLVPAMFDPGRKDGNYFVDDFETAKAQWANWKEILPSIRAYRAREDQAHAELKKLLAQGPWASWFPMACMTFSWGAGVLMLLMVFNGFGLLLRRMWDSNGPWRRGLA